jgi:hypothetical protein
MLTVQIEFEPPDISIWNGTIEVATDSSTTPEFEVRLTGYGADPIAPPAKPTNPNPPKGNNNASTTAVLRWSPVSCATSYNVYFGTDPTPDSTEFRANQAGDTYNPGNLEHDTTFYWRIDAKNSHGTTTGDTWSFRTRPMAKALPFLPTLLDE